MSTAIERRPPGPREAGTEASLPVPSRRRRAGLVRWLKITFLVAAGAAGVWYVVASWPETGPALARIGWLPALASIVPAVAAIGASMLTWRRLLADLGHPLPVRPAGRVYFTSQLGKYLPGSVWTFVAQLELGRDLKVPRPISFAASILALALSLTAGLCVAVVLVPFGAGAALTGLWWLWLAVPVLMVAFHPRMTTGGMNLVLRLLRRAPLTARPTVRGTLAAASWQLLSWTLMGLHCFLLARAAGATGWSTLPLAIGGFALAYCAGLLFVPAPAGVGVRELVLGAALAAEISPEAALAVVLVSRLALTVADLGMAAAFAGRRRAGVPADDDDPKHEE